MMTFLGHLWNSPWKQILIWATCSILGEELRSQVQLQSLYEYNYMFLHLGQAAWLDSGTLAQEKRRVPPPHAKERREQRWTKGTWIENRDLTME